MRIKLNPNGTRSIMSFSSFGDEGEDAELTCMFEQIAEDNRAALDAWNALSPEAQAQRTAEFEAEQKERQEQRRKDFAIPPHLLALFAEQERQSATGDAPPPDRREP